MRKLIILAAVLLCASAVYAAQDSALTIRNVRDPVQLRDKLNANALDAQTRIAVLETSLTTNADVVVTGTMSVGGVATFTSTPVLSDGLSVATNAAVGGTLGVTGLTTLTGNAAANELDTRTATALLLGKATATSVTIGASDAGVSIPGTLAVTGVATLTAAPKLVTTNDAGAITLTMTNGPTAADAGKATPSYIRITIGTTSYVIPAWPLTP
jgi:hypothetical protein